MEIPTPRWTDYDKAFFGEEISEEVPLTLQERVYTSPIWYSPAKTISDVVDSLPVKPAVNVIKEEVKNTKIYKDKGTLEILRKIAEELDALVNQ